MTILLLNLGTVLHMGSGPTGASVRGFLDGCERPQSYLGENMSKDPAFLFYYRDWLVGTATMSLDEKGAMIELLAHLADKGGKLTEAQIKKILGRRFKLMWFKIGFKFEFDGSHYSNLKLSGIMEKRLKFCASRKINRSKGQQVSHTSETSDRLPANATANANPLVLPFSSSELEKCVGPMKDDAGESFTRDVELP